jgi:hypothetical protein
MVERLGTMGKTIGNAVVEHPRDLRDHLGAEIPPDHIAAERQWQSAGALGPPFAQIDDLLQALVLIRELALVNEQPGGDLAFTDRVLNAIERHDHVGDVGS